MHRKKISPEHPKLPHAPFTFNLGRICEGEEKKSLLIFSSALGSGEILMSTRYTVGGGAAAWQSCFSSLESGSSRRARPGHRPEDGKVRNAREVGALSM